MKIRVLVTAVLSAALMLTNVPAGVGAPVADSGRVPAVISFVGDLNVTFGSTQIALAFTRRDAPYAVVDLARSGAAIRSPDCAWIAWFPTPCPTHDFWRTRLAEANAKIASDAYVVNLGANDIGVPGTDSSPGYAQYPAKIDWLMQLLGGKPVFWTNLPCAIEPPGRAVGCQAVNTALAGAALRWPNLRVINWAAVANSHPEYVSPMFGVGLYTRRGATVWANTVVAAADAGLAKARLRTPAAGPRRPAVAVGSVATKSRADHVPAAVSLVGDSNITFGSTQIALAFTQRDAPYAVVDLARGGTSIRSPDCAMTQTSCATHNFWQARLAQANAKIATDAYVVDLGINDTAGVGTASSPGYSRYSAKIDWMMPNFHGKPVFWTNLPCAIEPPARAAGCAIVNAALAGAALRWHNLKVIDWASVANSHPEYIKTGDVHYRPAGLLAWAATVAGATDKTFGQTTPAFLKP